MSGFVGIIQSDTDSVDPSLLEKLTARLAVAGPDRQQIWHHGSAGFGHALLRTTFESAHERQPLSLDGRTYIAADTRKVTFADAGIRLSGEQGWSVGDDTSIAPFASAAWRRAWGDRNGGLSGRFAGGGTAFTVLGPVVAKDAAELGLGLELRSGPVRFSAGYNGSLASGWTNHSAQMKVSVGF